MIADIYAGFFHILSMLHTLSMSLAPARSFFISTPAIVDGNRPTAENTEYLPPTFGGMERVLKPSSPASFLKGPFIGSVFLTNLFFYFFPTSFFNNFFFSKKL